MTPYTTYSRLGAGPDTALVNIISGNLVIDPVDLAIAGRGVSIVVERFYNSSDTTLGYSGQVRAASSTCRWMSVVGL